MSTVLVAEDDDDILALVRTCLEREGYDVVEARDGALALERMREQPDLLVLDIGLPMVDGIEVLKEAQRDARLRSIPVVILTAKAQEADIRRGLEAGAQAYIPKPFSPTKLAQVVRGLLAQPPGAA
ncbi:MAG TPA: response regulator [Gaiellaceae bacterium]|nr:response regulator [Gaiellaceae bacterium]